MATQCPKCKKHTLKLKKDNQGKELYIYCDGFKQEKKGDDWVNVGECDFRMFLANKHFGNLKIADVKDLIDGKTIENKKGDVIKMDLTKPSFLHINFAKNEDF